MCTITLSICPSKLKSTESFAVNFLHMSVKPNLILALHIHLSLVFNNGREAALKDLIRLLPPHF